MKLGDKIRRLRLVSGLTGLQFAEIAGIKYDQLRQIERDLASPKMDKITKWCDHMNMSVETFISDF